MKKITCLLLVIPALVFAQNWVNTLNSKKFDRGTCIEFDAQKNIFMAGTFEDTVDMDPSPKVARLIPKGASDVYLMKTTSKGELLWAQRFGSKTQEQPPQLEVDAYGNSYLSFSFTDTLRLLIKGKDVVLATKGTYPASSVLLKVDSKGELLWAQKLGTKGPGITKLMLDYEGMLWLAGAYTNEALDVDH